MTDIVERLRQTHYCGENYCWTDTLMDEAADEIERLRGALRSRCIRCDPGEACIGICGAPPLTNDKPK